VTFGETTVWQPRRLPHRTAAPRALWPWLTEPGSLTRRMRELAGERFDVRVIGEGWGRPWRDEALRVRERARRLAWVREVMLCCGDEPWIHARTVAPAAVLTGPLRRLRYLGRTPIGAMLFGRHRVERGPIEVARLGASDRLYRRTVARLDAKSAPVLWARRSAFSVAGRGLLVTEVFLPGLVDAVGRRGRGR